MYNPLEQFANLVLTFGYIKVPLETLSFFVLFIYLLTYFYLINMRCREWKFPRILFFYFNEVFSVNILTYLINYMYINLFFIFCFVLLLNVWSMIPFSFAPTGQIIITLSLSWYLFFGLNLIGGNLHGIGLVSLFVIKGVPGYIKPFLTIIEVISYFARLFSLAIRLFANIMAGHTLLAILTDFILSMLISLGILAGVSLLPFVIVSTVLSLEFYIAFLQAYVFVLLLILYLLDVINLH